MASCHRRICCCLDTKWCPTLLWPHGLQPTRLLCPWVFPGKRILGWVAIWSSQPRDQTLGYCTDRQILYRWANREARRRIYTWEFAGSPVVRALCFLSLPRAEVLSLVGALRSLMLCSVAKNNMHMYFRHAYQSTQSLEFALKFHGVGRREGERNRWIVEASVAELYGVIVLFSLCEHLIVLKM